MNQTGKIIKYVAIALGIFLSISIISAIVTGIATIFVGANIIEGLNNVETADFTKEYENISNIKIDIPADSLEIIKGEKFLVEASNVPTKYEFKQDENTLVIKSNKLKGATNSKIIIYVPEKLKEVDITIGAGSINLKDIIVEEFDLKVGAATLKMDNVEVTNKTEIETGVGETNITNCNFKDLELESGVGKVTFIGKLSGKNKIESGVGAVDLELLGQKEDYKIKVQKGLGTVNINGVSVKDSHTEGIGETRVDISGGVGSINIKY